MAVIVELVVTVGTFMMYIAGLFMLLCTSPTVFVRKNSHDSASVRCPDPAYGFPQML